MLDRHRKLCVWDRNRNITKDAKTKFDTSGYLKDENRPLPIGGNKSKIDMIKDELGGKL